MIVDVGSNTGMSSRLPPLTPEAFAALLEQRTFTNGADKEVVLDLYCTTARAVIGRARVLKFGGLRWRDEDVVLLSAWLEHASALREISLVGNRIGDAGALALVEVRLCGAVVAAQRSVPRSSPALGSWGLAGGAQGRLALARATQHLAQ